MAIKPYTPKELNIMESLLKEGHSAEYIANTIGRSKRGMMRKGREIGLSFWPDRYKKQSKKHRYTSNDYKIVKSLAGKKPVDEIGKIIGVSGKCIYEKYRKMGISFTLFNEYHPQCKYSSKDVELIRQLHDEGISVCEIARKFEIPHQTVSDYIRFASRIKYDVELVDN